MIIETVITKTKKVHCILTKKKNPNIKIPTCAVIKLQTLTLDSRQLRFLPDICNADVHKTAFSAKTYTIVNELLNGL